MTVEGIPKGWEEVRFDYVNDHEFYLGGHGEILVHMSTTPTQVKRLVIREIEKPKKYRPFANAAEFEPHRDRWVVFYDSDYQALSDEKSKIMTYGDSGVWVADRTTVYEWAEAFKSWRFDDGTPFGVEVTE